ARTQVENHTFDRAATLGQKLADIDEDGFNRTNANLADQCFANPLRQEEVQLSVLVDLEGISGVQCCVELGQFDQVIPENLAHTLARRFGQPSHIGEQEL